MTQLELEFDDVEALRHAYDDDLRHGRAFVPGLTLGVEAGAPVAVTIVHPESRTQLDLRGTVTAVCDDPPGLHVRLADPRPLDRFVSLPPRPARLANVNERIRTMPIAEQQKLARHGELQERVALERLFGKNVWEALLHNPRLTIPEVARIARKGTVPRPLLELIVDNAAWVKTGPVRRALLTNPRIGSEAIIKILRLTPKNELKLVEKQTAYPAAVRETARKLLK